MLYWFGIGFELLSACLVAEVCQASKVFLMRKEPLSITRELSKCMRWSNDHACFVFTNQTGHIFEQASWLFRKNKWISSSLIITAIFQRINAGIIQVIYIAKAIAKIKYYTNCVTTSEWWDRIQGEAAVNCWKSRKMITISMLQCWGLADLVKIMMVFEKCQF